MAEVWLLEFFKAVGKLFLHPVLYFSIALVLVAGYLRMKRERRDFNVRVHGQAHELKHLWPAGLLAGAVLSVISLFAGFTMPMDMVILIAIFTIVLGIAGNGRLLSPAMTIGLPVIIVFESAWLGFDLPFIQGAAHHIHYLLGMSFLIGLLLLAEGLLILKDGLRDVSPKLRKSRRGLTVGALQMKRLWLLPIFLFVPAGFLTPPVDWWPAIQIGAETYSLILVPFLMGFQQQVQADLPRPAAERLGKRVIWLSVVILALAIGGLFYPAWLPPVAVAVVAIIGRGLIAYAHRVQENNHPYYYAPLNEGLMILGVIPDSPANKMELKIGEVIRSCNGVQVAKKDELYQALLKNRAYCKLEVLDARGEVRFVQRALYEGDHHELGILFVEERPKRTPAEAM